MNYQEIKEFLSKQLVNPNMDKELVSKLMSVVTWIQKDEEMKSNNFSKFTQEELNEIGARLQKKFQSGLETK
jgi:hypothetical protein